MITIHVPQIETYNSSKNEFTVIEPQNLIMEHSLISISKWESKWHKPFLTNTDKTNEETLDYLRCMTINSNVDPIVYHYISNEDILRIKEYIDNSMTATTFSNNNNRSRQIITAEIVYYWMITFGIPFECQKWHLNRLLTLINVCSIKNAPAKKMSKSDIRSRNAALNAARRKQFGTRG